MAEKNLNVRIVNKHDVEENWLKATTFVPKQGELIVYDVDENYSYERFKIGDGVTVVNALPFAAVQSDWNQNDSTALDYIKNRTHYEAIEEIVVIPSTEVCNRGIISVADPSVLEAGKQCVVTVNGTRYETTIRSEANLTRDGEVLTYPIGIGSWMAMNMSTSSISIVESIANCPFVLVLMGNSLMFAYESDDAYNGVYAVEVSILGSVVHQLDEKFIPDTLARVNHIHSTLNLESLLIGGVDIEQFIENIVQKMMDAGRIMET